MRNFKSLEKVYWQDIRDKLSGLQPEFTSIVDELDPGKDLSFYIARYKYGDLILDQGDFCIPDEGGQLHRIDDPSIPLSVREDLGYGGSAVAAGIVLRNSIEVFVTPNDRVVPYWFYKTGVIFALWTYLDEIPYYHPTKVFSITAGARSIFLLPCIGDAVYHHNLERYFNTRFPMAKNLSDQHQLFKNIVNHPRVSSDWYTEILFFSRKWIEKIHSDDFKWIKLQKFLYRHGWCKTAYWRNQLFYSMGLSWAQDNRKLRFNPYLVDTVKHMLAIITGYAPAFVPAVDNVAAPVKFLQQIFLDVYKMRDYIPTIMHPETFSSDPEISRPVYYSLQFPTTVEFSPRSTKTSIALQDLKELHQIIQIFSEDVASGRVKLEDTPISVALEQMKLDYFHNKTGRSGSIKLAKNLPQNDPNLLNCLAKYEGKREFSSSGPFLRGCVRFSLREDQF